MKDLTEDLAEVDGAKARRWVAKARREAGAGREDPVSWIAHLEQEIRPGQWDYHMVSVGRSPGDVLGEAECIAANARHRFGTGTWIMETFGDGENAPLYLRVKAHLDDE